MAGWRRPAREKIEAEAARFLGGLHARSSEENVRTALVVLFGALDAGTIEAEYPVDRGRADLYLPNQRTFFEIKKPGAAADPDAPGAGTGESPSDQLHRYVRGEIERESSWGAHEKVGSERPWTGVVTDGFHWRVFRYRHEADAVPQPVGREETGREDKEALAGLVERILGEWVGKPWVPADPSALLEGFRKSIVGLYENRPRAARPRIETKRILWLDTIRASGMAPEDESARESLFIAHSFLIAVVRLVRATRDPSADPLEAVADGFASWLIDFTGGEKWVEDLWAEIGGHDWIRRRSDVIREIYQSCVSRKNRRMFGEFYTPDWLAEMMVMEILDAGWLKDSIEKSESSAGEGVGILDPACGSGTFLYHAALRIIEAPETKHLSAVEKANVVAHLVNGVDIHPVAVEMAKANLMRALPAPPTQGESALRVFVGDSLQAARKGDGGDLLAHTDDHMILKPPRSGDIRIPMEFVRSPTYNSDIRRMVATAAEGGKLPRALRERHRGVDIGRCHEQFIETIKTEGNSVWAWYAVNVAALLLLAERKIDRIVANPPWVRLSHIQVADRRRMMEDIGKKLGVQAGGKLAGNLDIAAFFVLQARRLYMNDPKRDPAIWLVKKAAINAGNWKAFRDARKGVVSQTIDLEELNPFGGGDARRSCLLMEHRKMRTADKSGARALIARPARAGEGEGRKKPPLPAERWAEAEGKIVFARAPRPFPEARSAYLAAENPFRSGARTAPSVLLIVDGVHSSGPGRLRVKTRRSRQDDWKDVDSKEGDVPAAWVKSVLYSEGCLAFVADFRTLRAVIPTDAAGDLHPAPDKECLFWVKLDKAYREGRGLGEDTPRTLMSRIDYGGAASKQLPLPGKSAKRTMVLYPASADIMRAARTHRGAGMVNDKLYWRVCDTESEAGYLTAILNAPCLRRAFKESRESGRDFNLHPWRKVPVPLFDPADSDHKNLAALCKKAEAAARAVVDGIGEVDRRRSQNWISVRIRAGIADSGVGGEIDGICRRLLPEHASGPET